MTVQNQRQNRAGKQTLREKEKDKKKTASSLSLLFNDTFRIEDI
jgi:hypothetical protein